jgi:class 3 adenylate cyclase
MPIYLDRHDAPGTTAEDVAKAHVRDLEMEGRHDVHYHTYWFDPNDGTIFCLAEGPNREAVESVHREAHGLMATSVIELDSLTSLNQFLGSMPSFPPGKAYESPAMRAIVFTDICGSVAQTHELGDHAHVELLHQHDTIVREHLSLHDGREVKHTGDGIMASFTSISSCVAFASAVQQSLRARNQAAETPLLVSIGISAGEPIAGDNNDLFGAAVQLAARLCAAAEPGEIAVTTAVRELCVGKQFRFGDRGELALKGIPDPVRVFTVSWEV